MDVVTHVQKRLWFGESLRTMKMDFLMVDEVQDLTPKTIQLLLSLTNHNVFFSGDTAQTIAKGVGARFLDLRHIFGQLEFDVPKIVQLTKNYRSHGRILDLANSVVDLIEIFFPKTIDKLQKEESETTGLVPIVIMPLDNQSLRKLFAGQDIKFSQSSESQNATQSSAPQFGCNQVLIVRDQEAKDSIPEIFQNILCLSVYESKGLEFDDVILYNFFHLGEVSKGQWKLLNDIVYYTVKKAKYDQSFLDAKDFDSLDVEMFEKMKKNIKEQEKQAEEGEEYEEEIQIGVSRSREEVYRKFQMLCIELKFLYVAITRAKKRVIIYDDVSEGRKPLQNYWEKLGLVDVITRDMIAQPEIMKEELRKLFFDEGGLNKSRSSEEEWRLQGIKLFKKKYYDASIKCFTFSGDEDLVKRCMAYQEADFGTNKGSEADSKVWRAKTLQYLTKQEKKKLIREAKAIRKECCQHYENAGFLFESIKMLKHAASCFYTAKNFIKAAEIFENLGQYGQAAECFMTVNQLNKAAQLYEKAGLVSLSIECYESAGMWEQLLHCLHRNKDFFRQEERESLVNKYVPVALNSLYKIYSEQDEELDEENKGKMQEMKIKLKYQKKVAVIEEEEELDEDSEQSEKEGEITRQEGGEEQVKEESNEVKEEGEKQEQQQQQEVEIEQQENNSQDQIELIEETEEKYDILEEVFQLKRIKSKKEEEESKLLEMKKQQSEEISFEVIEQDQKDTKKEEEQEEQQEQQVDDEEEEKKDNEALEMKDEFEHLSQYDPDDEFLRSGNSMSIIESILSKKSISQTSEFSIVTSKQGGGKDSQSLISMSSKRSKNSIAFVEPNRDIYAEDVITQKIIYYVSLFSGEVFEHLQKIRSKNVLFSKKEESTDKQIKQKEDDFLIDLDDVDSDFINLILDALEYYELFRLCLMICNRYHMSERLGRYLVSVCSKYSNLHLQRFNIDLMRSNHFNLVWKKRQRDSSILAHEAIHNVFTLINPKFLSLKEFDCYSLNKENSLGVDTYRMMLELGFWKKLVYILPGKVSLQICDRFFDRDNFEILLELLHLEKEDQIKFSKGLHEKVVLKNTQSLILKKIQEIEFIENSQQTFKEIEKELLEEEKEFEQLIKKQIKISKWLYTPMDQLLLQKIKTEEESFKRQKLQEKMNYQTEQILVILREQLNTNKNTYSHYFFAFSLLQVISQTYVNKFLTNVRESFDIETLQSLVDLFIKALKVLNMETQSRNIKHDYNDIQHALYGAFLLSPLGEFQEEGDEVKKNSSDGEEQIKSIEDLFKHYRHSHVLVNRNSFLMKDIVLIQNNMVNKVQNQFLAHKLQDLRPKYFRIQNFNSAVISQYNDFLQNQKQKYSLFLDKNEFSFILDMDGEFILVPKAWVTKLLASKLLNISVQLSNELKHKIKKAQKDKAGEKDTKTNKDDLSMLNLEQLINQQGIEIQIMDKVNKELKVTALIQQEYARRIVNEQDKLKVQLMLKNDFNELVQKYWKKFTLNQLSFNSTKINAIKMQGNSFSFILNHLKLSFDLGIMYSKQSIVSKAINPILNEAIDRFEQAFCDTKMLQQFEDSDETTLRLNILVESLQYFILIDKYEYLTELIKKKKRQLMQKDQSSVKQQLFLLQKFMIAIDIHVYLKNGSFSLAADSMFSFLQNFYDYLTYQQRVQVISNAFYLVLIAKFGKVYVPDYSLKFVDIAFNLNQYYEFVQVIEESLVLVKQNSYQGDERIVIDYSIQNKEVEVITSDTLYNEALYWTLKLLKNLNKDETGPAQKTSYKRLFNIVMSACVNDMKKSDKTLTQLVDCFKEFTESPFEEYFQLPDTDFTTKKGIQQLTKDFKDTEKQFKWEFFSTSKKHYGQFLAYIDASQSQTNQAQVNIKMAIDKAYYQELRVLACHVSLSCRLKRLFKQKRKDYAQQARMKEIQFEERQFINEQGLKQLMFIEKLPFTQILKKLLCNHNNQIMLRQMIAQKYATNSQDLHFILSKANELEKQTDEFRQFLINFIKEKGEVLIDFVDVENMKKESLVDEVQVKLDQQEELFAKSMNDLNNWMERKAEPNLVEVERKNKKYKLKWEQLNVFEKKQKILALRKKAEIIQNN